LYKFIDKFIDIDIDIDIDIEDFKYVIMGLIAKKQFNILDRIFKENQQIKDKYLAYYYANLRLNNRFDELDKIPIELKDDLLVKSDLDYFQNIYQELIVQLREDFNKIYDELKTKV
jgi:hypothetical protein